MISGWTYYATVGDCHAADARRNSSTQYDYITNQKNSGWIDPQGTEWLLTFDKKSKELILYAKPLGKGPAWVSRPWSNRTEADAALNGYESSGGNWQWLLNRIGNRP